MTGLNYLDYTLLGAGMYVLNSYVKQRKLPAPLPPGPRGLPVIGNAADMPTQKDWLTYAKWGREYGGIMSVNAMGQPIIIVNSVDVMQELDKKGALYSDRPRLEMGGELVGYSETLVLIPYGERFRVYRKNIAKYIGGAAQIKELHPLIESSTRKFLQRTLASPDDLMIHLRKLQGNIILKLTYGIDGRYPRFLLGRLFPRAPLTPEWLPGMGFMETARRWAGDTLEMVEAPYKFTLRQMETGTASKSYVSTILEDGGSLSADEIRDLKFSASSLYGGGADTTVSAEYAFHLAMVLFPEVQRKAQAEIDAVIGNDRLPTFQDIPNLPYVGAIVTEILRWNSVAPTGVPHRATEDGIVAGYFIPKDAIIMCNLWNMLHDESIWPEPFKFSPERYLGANPQRNPRDICFGYGRRICPGMYLAEAALSMTIAMTLAAFNITNAMDSNGVPIVPKHENTSGTISYPEPFKCTIKPRSEKAAALVSEEYH
ncbi:hypothetical protein D9756_010068 [Leucocoprinus leucothites]|uniref:Cytochrome P450 n=1 Tax=Leucocoprinus leucothites TaxID=201217 RepID=A0A8H5FR18_9AGAR|nr:hypothetical protein D9756_010068 [Leucoagaricus leucothites]